MHTFKKFKVARRLGVALFDKCNTGKFNLQKTRTGKRGGMRKQSDYSVQLTEKQKVRYFYNVTEKQFKNYVTRATHSATPGRTLFELLETRLDNAVYRLGFAPTRQAARQMVSHGHIMVNGRRVDVPSFSVSKDDVISFREGSRSSRIFEIAKERVVSSPVPGWLQLDGPQMTAKITGTPADPDSMLNFSSVIEFYSR